MSDEIKEIINYMKQYVENIYEHDSEPMLNWKDLKKLLDYITNLQTIEREYSSLLSENAELQQENEQLEKIADSRMKTLLKIEQYCIDEKEDLICGGEVCEDVLKIIDELKGE